MKYPGEQQENCKRTRRGSRSHELTALRKLAAIASVASDPEVAALGNRLLALADGVFAGDPADALGLPSRWRCDNARARRDNLIRQIVANHYPTETQRGRARTIFSGLKAYYDHHHHRLSGPSNPHLPGSREALFWEVLRVQDRLPEPLPSVRTIREILRDAAPGEMVLPP